MEAKAVKVEVHVRVADRVADSVVGSRGSDKCIGQQG